jgi:hypothetical protein
MAKLNTYYTVPPTLDDILFGTDNTIPSRTRNFTVAGLFALYNTTYNVIPPTLQIVTTNGAITTNTVYLNGGALSNSINEQAIFQPDLISTVNLNSGSGASIDSTGKVALSPDGLVSTLFASDNITQDITLQAPNKTAGSYTLATIDDIPAAQVNSDWDATSGVAEILNKPTIPAAVTKTSDLTNDGEDGVNPFITANDIPPVTGFVPYTGATEDVDLGEFEIKAGQVEFDQTPTGTAGVGVMRWNDSDGTVDLGLKGGNVTLQVGQEQVLRVVNKTATNINLLEANYQAVRVTGAQGQRLKVDLAQAINDTLSAETIGLVTETINNNQEGFITTSGLVRGINTTGSLQGETWADGDILYLSPTTAGNATKVKPVAPNHLIILGYVIRAHINQGSIFVKVDNGYELEELHNVKITSAANNNVLAYTSATDIWENKTVETALGYTPFQLPSLTSGSVLFSNGTTIAQDNSQFFWDDTNNRLGIGTTNFVGSIKLAVNGQIGGPTFSSTFLNLTGGTPELRGNSGIGFYGAGGNIIFYGTASAERMRLFANGNLAINTTTDAGYKLDVNGTARVNNNLSVATSSTSFSGLTVGGAASQNYVTIDSTQNAELRFHLNGGMKSILRQFSNEFRFYNTSGAILANWHVVNNNFVFSNTTIGPVADTSSVMEIRSTDRGFLPPRMTTTQKNAIAAPAAGLVVYDTDLNQLCTYDGTWGDSPFYQQSLRGVRFFTDFDSSTKYDKLVSSTGGVAASVARLNNFVPNQTANQIGIAQYQTGTSTTGWALHITEQSANAMQFQFGGGTWMYESYIEVDILSDATNRFRFISGFGNVANSGTETNGAFFTYDEGGVSNGTIASPNWQCVTTVGAVRTLTTTSVAVTTTWTKLRIIVNAAATEVKFYIDGILVATHTTNIPVLPTRIKVLQKLVKNLGTGNRFVYCDYIFYENNLTTLR